MDRNEYMRNYRHTHPKVYQKELERNCAWKQKHPEYMKNYRSKPEYKLLQRIRKLFKRWEKARIGRIEALFKLGGTCVLCFETDPFKVETHHPFGRIHHPEIMILLCRSCHRKTHENWDVQK